MTVLLSLGGTSEPPPSPPPVDVVSQWRGLNPTWVGWDGSVWRLSDPRSNVMLGRGGTRGLSMPPVERQSVTSPSLAGSRHRSSRVAEREVFWPLVVFGASSSADWVKVERAFWRTMHPERPGTWWVTLPDGSQRSLRCRFVDDGSQAYDLLPVVAGWARYGVTLVAEQPFWQGDPVTLTWGQEPENPLPTYPTAAGAGYLLYLTSGLTFAEATVANAGDVEAFPVWTVAGPSSSAAVGVTGRKIVVPFSLAEGERVVINTDPEFYSAVREDGTDVTHLLGETDWAPVPDGETVPLSIEMVGTGSVSMTLPQNYLRAW